MKISLSINSECEDEEWSDEFIENIIKEKKEILPNINDVKFELEKIDNNIIKNSENNNSDDTIIKNDDLSNDGKLNENFTEKNDMEEILNSRKEFNIFGYDFNNKNILKSILLNNNNNESVVDSNFNDNKNDIDSDDKSKKNYRKKNLNSKKKSKSKKK